MQQLLGIINSNVFTVTKRSAILQRDREALPSVEILSAVAQLYTRYCMQLLNDFEGHSRPLKT